MRFDERATRFVAPAKLSPEARGQRAPTAPLEHRQRRPICFPVPTPRGQPAIRKRFHASKGQRRASARTTKADQIVG